MNVLRLALDDSTATLGLEDDDLFVMALELLHSEGFVLSRAEGFDIRR